MRSNLFLKALTIPGAFAATIVAKEKSSQFGATGSKSFCGSSANRQIIAKAMREADLLHCTSATTHTAQLAVRGLSGSRVRCYCLRFDSIRQAMMK